MKAEISRCGGFSVQPLPVMNSSLQFEQACQELSLIFCELVSLLVFTTQCVSSSNTRRNKSRLKGPKDAWTTQQIQRVGDYILQLLRGEATASSQLGKPLTHGAYVALLPSIWALLDNTRPELVEMSGKVLQAIVQHSLKTSSKSAVKRLTIEFIARLILVSNGCVS